MLLVLFPYLWSVLKTHWKVGKIILRHVAGTLGYGLWYTHIPNSTLIRCTNSDFAGSIDDRKNTFGYAFHLGTNLVSWTSQKQPIVSMSSTEAEYVAATTSACHAVWLKILLKDMGHTEKDPTSIFCDNSLNITYFIEKANTLTLTIISFVS